MTGIEPDRPDVQPPQREPDWLSPDLPWGTDPAVPAVPAAGPDPGDPAEPGTPALGAAPPPKRPLWRPLGALLCFGASILTLFATFLTLFTSDIQVVGVNRFVVTITSWELRATTNGVPEATPGGLVANHGPPLIVAAIVLVAAAVAGLLAAAAPSSVAITRIGSLTALGGAAFLAGITLVLTMEELSWLDQFRPGDSGGPQFTVDASIEIGFWLLAIANAAAIAGTVFAFLPLGRRLRRRTEPDTPPMGFPTAVVVHRLPDEPPDEPTPT